MLRNTLTAISMTSVIAFAAFTAAPAHAGDNERLASCRVAVADQAGVDTKDVKFRSLTGSSLKRFKFEVKNGESDQIAECRVRRNDIVEIEFKD